MLDFAKAEYTFFFSNVQDIGRMHGASIPLLRTIFQVALIFHFNYIHTEILLGIRHNKLLARSPFLGSS